MRKFFLFAILLCLSLVFYSCTSDEEIEVEVEELISKREFFEAKKMAATIDGWSARERTMKKITESELSIIFGDGDFETAMAYAVENDCQDELMEVMTRDINKVYSSGKIYNLFTVLAGWGFDNAYQPKYTECYSPNEVNRKYNEEVEEFNNIITSIFNIASLVSTKNSDTFLKG